MIKNTDDALHASYSKHLAQGSTIKGLIKFAKDKGLNSPEVWSHNGEYALRFTGRDGETKQLSLGSKYNQARRVILSLGGKPKAKAPTRVLGAVPASKQGTQKPYVSSSRGVYEVLDTRGKPVFKSKDKQEALKWFNTNYNAILDGRLSLADPGGLKSEQVMIGGKPHTVKFVVDTAGSNDEWTATAFNAEGKKVGAVKAYDVGKGTRAILLKKVAGLALSLAEASYNNGKPLPRAIWADVNTLRNGLDRLGKTRTPEDIQEYIDIFTKDLATHKKKLSPEVFAKFTAEIAKAKQTLASFSKKLSLAEASYNNGKPLPRAIWADVNNLRNGLERLGKTRTPEDVQDYIDIFTKDLATHKKKLSPEVFAKFTTEIAKAKQTLASFSKKLSLANDSYEGSTDVGFLRRYYSDIGGKQAPKGATAQELKVLIKKQYAGRKKAELESWKKALAGQASGLTKYAQAKGLTGAVVKYVGETEDAVGKLQITFNGKVSPVSPGGSGEMDIARLARKVKQAAAKR
jgi:hypothetical protein